MNACPTCHRPFHQTGRICASCGKPIGHRHRWHADGIYNRHDDCSNVTLEMPDKEPLMLLAEKEEANGEA